jgi:hypothetical protein
MTNTSESSALGCRLCSTQPRSHTSEVNSAGARQCCITAILCLPGKQATVAKWTFAHAVAKRALPLNALCSSTCVCHLGVACMLPGALGLQVAPNMNCTRDRMESCVGSYGQSLEGISKIAGNGLWYAETDARIMFAICTWRW